MPPGTTQLDDKNMAIKAFAQALNALDPDRLTKQEIEEFLTKITEHVKKIDQRSEERLAAMAEALQRGLENTNTMTGQEVSRLIADMKKDMDTQMSEMRFQHEAMMSECQAKIDTVLDGDDGDPGKDADETVIVEKVLARIKLPETQIIDVEKIKQEILAAIPQPRMQSIGASVVHKFIDDETPSGTKNGSNTQFYLSKAPINGSLKLYRGGARQRVTEDYTLVGKLITFTVAPESTEILLADYRYI